MTTKERLLFKDEILNTLAEIGNVAQFVSFDPDLKQRFCRVMGLEPNRNFTNVTEAVTALLNRSPEGLLNVRTYRPERPEGNPFLRKLSSVDAVVDALKGHAADGLHTIVNENIDENDGGVSGVSHAGQLEFAPDATPRCVDDPKVRTARLPFEAGCALLRSVYGFTPSLPNDKDIRTEFSIHPKRRGWRHQHTTIWQQERTVIKLIRRFGSWPNAFSRFIGDKVYGLLVASVAGLPVPRTTVFHRRVFQFSFGEPTGTSGMYTRTAPEEKVPGYYPSCRGWADPFAVLADYRVIAEDGYQPQTPLVVPKDIKPLASVLVQEEVSARYSGRLVYGADESPIVDGVEGGGEHFMLGAGRGGLPREIVEQVRQLAAKAREKLGLVEIEWVYDGARVWIVQLHLSKKSTIVLAQEDLVWVDFRYDGPHMIETFRQLARSLKGKRKGINVIGNSSPLSHLGEIAIYYSIPAKFED